MKDLALSRTAADEQAAADAIGGYEKDVLAKMVIVRHAFLGPPKMVDDIERGFAECKPLRKRGFALAKEGKKEESETVV